MNGDNAVLFNQGTNGQPGGASFPSAAAAYNAIRVSGTADYNSWQYMRRKWYYKQSYPEAGQNQLVFFSNPAGVGGLNVDDTNIPVSNGFGNQYVIIKSIEFGLYTKTWDLYAWAGTDASTLVSDILLGLTQGGVVQLAIGNRLYAQAPMPLLYMPPGDGEPQVYTRGLDTLTLTEGTPNTLLTSRSAAPFAELVGFKNKYWFDPYIGLIPREAFNLTIDYPTGLIPVIGTDITDDTTNPLKIVARLDTITFRALQG